MPEPVKFVPLDELMEAILGPGGSDKPKHFQPLPELAPGETLVVKSTEGLGLPPMVTFADMKKRMGELNLDHRPLPFTHQVMLLLRSTPQLAADFIEQYGDQEELDKCYVTRISDAGGSGLRVTETPPPDGWNVPSEASMVLVSRAGVAGKGVAPWLN